MNKDLIAQKIMEILNRYGNEYGLEEFEKEWLSMLISTVVRSD